MTDKIYEKMSKSKGNVILPEEVVYGIHTIKRGYVFRDFCGDIIEDFKEKGVWQDRLNTGFFFTATRYDREPVWLCKEDDFDDDGKPIPLILLIDGEEKAQHPEEIDKVKYFAYIYKDG